MTESGLRRLLAAAITAPPGVLLRASIDAAFLGIAMALTWLLAPEELPGADTWQIWALPPLTMLALAANGMYRPLMGKRPLDVAGNCAIATTVGAVLVFALLGASDPAEGSEELAVRAWAYSTIILAGGRGLIAQVRRSARSAGMFGKTTLIVGTGEIAARLEDRFRRDAGIGLQVVGFLATREEATPGGGKAPVLGSIKDLDRVVATTETKHVVLAFGGASDEELFPIARRCIDLGLDVSVVPRLFEVMNRAIKVEHAGGYPMLRLQPVEHRSWQFTVKYALGIAAAALLLLLLSPLMIALALAVKLTSHGPVLFRQTRVGTDGHVFEMLKFRSMRMSPEPSDQPAAQSEPEDPTQAPGGVEGEDRRTAVGKFIRRTSLDELPQLLNVLRGDMTLVGPRPERPQFVDRFHEHIRRYDDRLRVKAGITGWAQVNGLRGKGSIEDRLELDNFYIENWSLALDLKILLMTLTTPISHDAE